ncbi:MAG TPA: hypothetical protein VGE07_00690 [Herpetosiphonaceae bacterium]
MIAENTLETVSKQEKIAWVSLISTLLITGYFVSKMFDYDWQLGVYSYSMAKIVANSIFLGIVAELICAAIRRGPGADAVEDERDTQIRTRATIISYHFLVVLLAAAIGTLAFSPGLRLDFVTPLLVAYVLLAMLSATGIVKNVAEIVQYRRGV